MRTLANLKRWLVEQIGGRIIYAFMWVFTQLFGTPGGSGDSK